jgi:hypothetical protein
MKDYEDILSSGEFTQRKKKVNGKLKGNRYENSIAKKLNKVFDTTEFCRTPGSGAFATTHTLPQHIKVAGDLITPINFRFIIECKNGYKIEIDHLVNKKSAIWDFIRQAKRDGESINKDWLLIYKKDRRKGIAISNVSYPGIMKVDLPSKCFLYDLDDLLQLPVENFFCD